MDGGLGTGPPAIEALGSGLFFGKKAILMPSNHISQVFRAI